MDCLVGGDVLGLNSYIKIVTNKAPIVNSYLLISYREQIQYVKESYRQLGCCTGYGGLNCTRK